MRLTPGRVPEAVVTVARTYGARGLLLRTLHEGRRSLGLFRDRPRHDVAPRGGVPDRFALDVGRLRAASDPAEALARADRVAEGAYAAYRWDWRALPEGGGWSRNPFTGHVYAPDAAWWRTPHMDREAGDIKDVWEPARFGWAYDLVRGWALNGDARYARAFHDRLADFRASAPPFRGVHWSCGQEVGIRAVAWLYAEANLPATASEAARLMELLGASGERVSDALGYAVSQRNNHGISEAAALVVLGDRLRGLHPEAEGWVERGATWLDRLVREQFAPDGWYVQHAFNYLRVALDMCGVAHRTLAALGRPLGDEAVVRLRAAVGLLAGVMDLASGEAPNHGANDGAWVHPVSLAPFRDMRPSLGAAAAAFGAPLPEGVTMDREPLAWMGLEPPRREAGPAPAVRTGGSGWATARVGPVAVFLRAGCYASRPGHVDPLHLDVRVGGREVVVDPGTYAYNAVDPLWRNGLAGARVHNGPLLDGEEPGIRGPRFLWLSWPEARLVEAREGNGGDEVVLVGEVPERCRRTVTVSREGVRVRDEILDPSVRRFAVRWTLHPAADPAAVRVDGPTRVVEGAPGDVLAWFSPRYGQRLPTRVVEAVRDTGETRVLETRIGAPRAA